MNSHDETVTINRQEVLAHKGLHYKQVYRLIGLESDYDSYWEPWFPSDVRVAPLPSIKWKWAATPISRPGVEVECACGNDNPVYVTRSFQAAIDAGFVELVAPVTR